MATPPMTGKKLRVVYESGRWFLEEIGGFFKNAITWIWVGTFFEGFVDIGKYDFCGIRKIHRWCVSGCGQQVKKMCLRMPLRQRILSTTFLARKRESLFLKHGKRRVRH